jgi:hypothetical protein
MIKTFVQATSGEGAASSNTSLTVQFRAQLEKLMQTLGQAPSFVKCIKPRDVISGESALCSLCLAACLDSGAGLCCLHTTGSSLFDSTKVLMQLVSSGVIETQVRRRVLLMFLHLLLRFHCPTRHFQRVRAQGWNVRMTHSDFIDQFGEQKIPNLRNVTFHQLSFSR